MQLARAGYGTIKDLTEMPLVELAAYVEAIAEEMEREKKSARKNRR